ncbi:hypothetical protein [Paraburkholderia fungorum]|uniref:hypothetical protein n=1 Tax=Paraburkholderia fungorum TaxID=134537 RepID=UPI003877AEA5
MVIEILVDGEGFTDVELIEIEDDAPMLRIVEFVAARKGEDAALFALFVEDMDEPCDPTQPVPHHHRKHVHHVHRHKRIEVTVDYGGETIERTYPPSATVKSVLKWAIGPEGFKIEPSYAAEMQLGLPGSTTPLPDMAHIGRFVQGHEHKLVLTLMRGVIPNG